MSCRHGWVQPRSPTTSSHATRAVGECGGAASDAEDAYNAYLLSVQAWQDCIEDTYCTPVTPKMQRQWTKAGKLLASVNNAVGE